MTLEEAGGEENLREKINIVSYWLNKIRYFILEARTKDHKKGTFREQKKALKNEKCGIENEKFSERVGK